MAASDIFIIIYQNSFLKMTRLVIHAKMALNMPVTQIKHVWLLKVNQIAYL